MPVIALTGTYQQLAAVGFDLNLEFIKVHFMVFIIPSLNHFYDKWEN